MGHIEETPDALLARRGGQQHGLVTADDVEAAGLSSHAMRRRVRKGIYRDEGRGLWGLAGWPATDEQGWLAACLAHGPDTHVAFNDAARLHDMPCRHPSVDVSVLCPEPAKSRRRGVATHRSRLLVPADRTIVNGIPVTSWARTWCDLSARTDLSDDQLLWIFDEGIRRGHMTAEEAHHTAARLRPARGRSMRRIRRLLARRPIDHDPGASQPEGRIALWLRAAGYGKAIMNRRIEVGGVKWEIDLSYDEGVLIDYHSAEFHGGANIATQEKDARKRATLERHGYAYFVFGPDDDEAVVVETVGRELERRRRAASSGRSVH